jgi:sugar/nucleoside kinase (ribokinase family)
VITTRLVHAGSAVLDLVYRIDHLPTPGSEVVASGFAAFPGGGFNVMAAAARTGLAVAYAGPHGTGPNGDVLRRGLAREGIDCLLPPDPARDSGSCVVLVTDDAERTFISHPGAEGHLAPGALDAIALQPGDVVFASGYPLSYAGSRDTLARFIGALPAGVPFVLDPAPVVAAIPADILAAVLARTTWLSLNTAEAAVVTGGAAPERTLAALRERCPSADGIVLRAGAGGCVVAEGRSEPVTVAGFPVTAIDTTGAGDVHIGAFLAALGAGTDAPEAARFANAAAALSVMRPGGGDAPTRDEIIDFLERNGERAPALVRPTGRADANRPQRRAP